MIFYNVWLYFLLMTWLTLHRIGNENKIKQKHVLINTFDAKLQKIKNTLSVFFNNLQPFINYSCLLLAMTSALRLTINDPMQHGFLFINPLNTCKREFRILQTSKGFLTIIKINITDHV